MCRCVSRVRLSRQLSLAVGVHSAALGFAAPAPPLTAMAPAAHAAGEASPFKATKLYADFSEVKHTNETTLTQRERGGTSPLRRLVCDADDLTNVCFARCLCLLFVVVSCLLLFLCPVARV